MIAGAFPPRMDKLRDELLRAVSTSGSGAVRARTVLNFAYSTDLSAILNAWVDPALADVKLCNRRSPLDVYATMSRSIPYAHQLVSEMLWLSSFSRELIEKRINHDDPLYVVSAFATLVTLGAIGKQEGAY